MIESVSSPVPARAKGQPALLFHLTVLPPRMPRAEALSQEIGLLQRKFGGEINYLNPNRRRNLRIPRLLFGLSQLSRLRRWEEKVAIHQIYNPDPFPFPLFALLRRPIVYVISSGVSPHFQPTVWTRPILKRPAALVVPDERSAERLAHAGLERVELIRSGIDLSRIAPSPPPRGPLHLLMASAPWTPAQFESKGVTALLEAARLRSDLHLTFLWRGHHGEAMRRHISAAGLEGRVRLVDRFADLNDELRGVHGVIVLAGAAGIVKAYPHSLLDGLAAGRPVLVSRAIPMADYVEEQGCGGVVEAITPASILHTLSDFEENYPDYVAAAQRVGRRDFDAASMIDRYQMLYQKIGTVGEG